MARKEELAEVKSVIEDNIADAHCGIFFTRNTAGDRMDTLFEGEFFTVDVCYGWAYFEVFGCTEDEASALKAFYMVHERAVGRRLCSPAYDENSRVADLLSA